MNIPPRFQSLAATALLSNLSLLPRCPLSHQIKTITSNPLACSLHKTSKQESPQKDRSAVTIIITTRSLAGTDPGTWDRLRQSVRDDETAGHHLSSCSPTAHLGHIRQKMAQPTIATTYVGARYLLTACLLACTHS